MTRSVERRSRLWLAGLFLFMILLAGGTVRFVLSHPENHAASAP